MLSVLSLHGFAALSLLPWTSPIVMSSHSSSPHHYVQLRRFDMFLPLESVSVVADC